jgi:protocatechuate 3,4-dioxygenase beta subunit
MGISRAYCITLILIGASASVFGQIGSSSLSGTVTDPSGAVVPNAIVTLTSAEQSVSRTTKTGPEGVYVIPTLAPGRYQVKVTANGFVEQQTQPF